MRLPLNYILANELNYYIILLNLNGENPFKINRLEILKNIVANLCSIGGLGYAKINLPNNC